MKPTKDAVINSVLAGCCDNHEWYRGYMSHNWPRIEADFQFLRRHASTADSILDIGAIPPLFVALLQQDGFQHLMVVDPFATTFEKFLRTAGIRHYTGNLLQDVDPKLKGQFDVVCLNEVIEHLSGNLLTAIDNAVSCLKPGGRLFVTTPNLGSISGVLALLWYGSGLASKPRETVRAQYERATAKYGYYGHLREFTAREVVDLIESFGLKHEASAFQPNYAPTTRIMKACAQIERLAPRYGLFGKHIFVRKL
jgi:SAM-dependent methyltransferase